ncbi:MAG TPA: hypothetical protein VNL16_05990 [Chloroflexota bacterium]|nr:hypothetical protein [Chloroflexota bacterium]
MRTRFACAGAILALGLFLLASAAPAVLAADPLDYSLPGGSGHFYAEANGDGGKGGTGYTITNADGIPFWNAYRQLGGPATAGYPISRRFTWHGFTVQAMQKLVLQWRPNSRTVALINVLDQLHALGKDSWLASARQTPPPFATTADTGLSWDAVQRRHWAFLDANPAIKARYWADPDPLAHFGLPTSYADEGNSFVIRTQRTVFQYWNEDVPGAAKGQVTIANAGDLAKEAGLFPISAITPEPPPDSATLATVTHDWRSPGYVAAVGGQLYDPRCVPLRSIGTNVPNLPFHAGLSENLDWLSAHHLRWLRVFATGHALGPDLAPRDAASASTALAALLNQVDAFNAAHDPSESIYVLVSLTDYYPPGVPGDQYAFDHPVFRLSPVLPAPWYRAGVQRFDFNQEHNLGTIQDMPNYEVNYKPWVEQIVSRFSQSHALLGWQLGNELKARGSPRNGISNAEAYAWYLAFTRDIVDTIRARDKNHLIFLGAQYVAELTDWPYRVNGQPQPTSTPLYHDLVNRMLADCGQSCWNVWSITAYDFNPYPLDDARVFSQAGIPVVATEYGFTRGTPAEMQARFGGDRAAAVSDGLARPWVDLAGQLQPREWSVAEAIAQAPLAGIAPWGSPAPGPTAALDADSVRGIAGAPDEGALWQAWSDAAAALEKANQAAGPAAQCAAYQSPLG